MEQTVQNISAIKEELQALERHSRELSKLIGIAKKEGDPKADTLIQEKKELDQNQIAALKEKINEQHLQNKEQTNKQNSKGKDQTQLVAPAPYPLESATNKQTPKLESLSFNINELGQTTDTKAWDDYAAQHPSGNVYYQTHFLRSIVESMEHKILLLSMRDDSGAIYAALPIIEQTSRLFGHLWTSIALVNYGGVLANNETIERKLIKHAATQATELGVKRLEIRGLYKRPCDWNESQEKASMWLPLPQEGSDTLLRSFKAKLRSQIKKSYSNEVTVRSGGQELIDDFYTVFARNMRDLGTPVYSKQFFLSMLNASFESQLVVIYHSQKPASAAFLIKTNNRMEIPWASTIRDYNRFGLNMVLYWEVLKYSCEQNCEIFDFGRSTINAPTYKFKKQWGAQAMQHHWYSFEPDSANKKNNGQNQASGVSTNNPKFDLLIAAWKKLPLWLANLMGPHIVKYIP